MMPTLIEIKNSILNKFHQELSQAVSNIERQPADSQRKAQAINFVANQVRNSLIPWIESLPISERTDASLILQYCFSVASLEYRNKVWPYEYMAFSRRVGELWEGFCSAAWDYPNRPRVQRFQFPDFNDVRRTLRARIDENIGGHERKQELQIDIDLLFEIIGDINMREDEVFSVDAVPHVIDFKSGFGSNEKGNMLRLQTVGRAYRLWNLNTKLLLLVRQADNNNYLRVLQSTGLWSVFTGDAAYNVISELTGSNMQRVRDQVINWSEDLSPEFLHHLANQPTDLRSYLEW